MMIKPVGQDNEDHNMAYTVHSMTPLARCENML